MKDAFTTITDTGRLEWVIKHKATAVPSQRMMTRRGGLTKENMEDVWVLEYVTDSGDLVMQTPDCGFKSFRDAIDAGIQGVTT